MSSSIRAIRRAFSLAETMGHLLVKDEGRRMKDEEERKNRTFDV
jgi:hypothetical protein